jgi:hypothetical protein
MRQGTSNPERQHPASIRDWGSFGGAACSKDPDGGASGNEAHGTNAVVG